ncbi:MAG: nitroreductase family protein [Candidatus Eremiobacterota bacterium]
MLKDIINKRRAYRSLKPLEVTEDLIKDFSQCAGLAPSCYNNQPWRYVFVYGNEALAELHNALPKANAWAKAASLIIAVFSKKELDCIVKGREYYSFDTGMATAFLILRATELGLVAHPMAGFDEDKAKEILNIPSDMTLITLIATGTYSDEISPELNEKQREQEKKRPERFPLEKFVFHNKFIV